MELVDVTTLERVVEVLREEFHWVVLDVARSWTETSLRVLDLADQILVITAFDLPTLHHTRREIELFTRLGYGRKVRLVANRCSPRDSVTEIDLAKFLERKLDVSLPNDFEAATACIDRGKPIGEIARNGPLDRAYRHLAVQAHEWCGVPLPPEEVPGSRIARLLRTLRLRRNGAA
jgi:Flp pilus assembly CpaE family ATPase